MNTKRWTILKSAIALSILGVVTSCAGPTPIPPVTGQTPWVMSKMEAEGDVSGLLAQCRMKIALTSLSKEWQQIPLFPGNVSVTSFGVTSGDEEQIYLGRTEEGYHVLVGAQGNYEIELTFVQSIREDLSGKSVRLPFLTAVQSLFRLKVPERDLRVTTNPVVSFGLSEHTRATEILLYGATSPEVTVTWQTRAPEAAPAAVVYAEQHGLFTFSKGILRIQSVFDFSVVQGSTNTVSMRLEEGLNLLYLDGTDIKKWEVQESGTERTLVVEFLNDIPQKTQLTLELEKTLESFPIEASLPQIAAVGVEREKGFVAVAGRKGIQLESTRFENASQIDVQELPRGPSTEDVTHLAFKYLKRPFAIDLRVSEVQAKVTTDVLTNATISKDSMRVTSYLLFRIRDTGLFQFQIKLDEDLKLVDLKGNDINNWQIKDNVLTVDLRSKAEGEYVLVLETEKLLQATDLVDVPVVEVLGVEREWGYVALTGIPGVKVDTVTVDGIRQINVLDLPGQRESVGQQQESEQKVVPPIPPPQKVDLAFRYLKHPYRIQISISDIMSEVIAEIHSLYEVGEKQLEVRSEISYDIRKAGVFQVRLKLAPEIKITSIEGPGIDDWKRDERENVLTVTFEAKTEGSYLLRLLGEVSIEDVTRGLAVPLVSAVDVKKERGFLAIQGDSSLRLKTDAAALEKLTEIDIQELPETLHRRAPGTVLAYKYLEAPWKLALAVEKIKPRVTAETSSFVSIGEALVTVAATVRYEVLYAGVSTFKVQLPPGVTNVDIEGENIKQKDEKKDPKGDFWTVQLHSPKKGTYELYVSFQREMRESSGPVQYEGIRVHDLERETGYVAVAARPDVELELDAEKLEGLIPIDERDIPDAYKRGISVPILMAFRYLKQPVLMPLEARQHDFAKVLVAVIEAVRLSTTISEQGDMMTDLAARIRNTREQYLELELPEDAKIWHTFVAGEQVTPQKGDRPGTMLVPIARAAPTAAGAEATFDVVLRWGRKLEKLGRIGTIRLACPRMNIPIMRLGWSVSLPKDHQLVSDAGNMERMEGFEPMLAVMDPEALRQTPPSGQKPQVSYDASDPQARKNNEALEAMQEVRGKGKQIQVSGGWAAGLPPMDTGRKPSSGNIYLFQTLISLDEPGTIESRYVTRSSGLFGRGLLILLILLGGYGFWTKARLVQAWKLGLVIAVPVVLLGIQTLLEKAYYEFFTTAVGTSALLAVILLVWSGVDKARAANGGRLLWSRPDKVGEPSPAPEPPKSDSAGEG